jgi:glutathionylspermidine synthase
MRRVSCAERLDWKARAEGFGFQFHTIDGEPYWQESAYYAFTLAEIERDLEAPSNELHAMCVALGERVVRDDEILSRLSIPSFAWDMIARSWDEDEPSLYGRFDLVYDGNGPAKLLEFNADTPTSLYEAGFFQWVWLEDAIAQGILPAGADQYNSIQEKLIAALAEIGNGRHLHVASVGGHVEDRGTTSYIEDCARQAGLSTSWVGIEEIGLNPEGTFVDAGDRPIELLFKLYPWEWLLAEEFGKAIPRCGTQFVEPPWKAMLSCKGILPLLWEMFPGHPNLLPAFFEDDPRKSALGASFARKPLYSREGANILLVRDAAVVDRDEGPYGAEGFVRQALVEIPRFGDDYTVIGSWIVGGEACGIGIREDASPITKNSSRFLPHAIIG